MTTSGPQAHAQRKAQREADIAAFAESMTDDRPTLTCSNRRPHPAHHHGRAATCPGVETPAHLRPEACYVCGAGEHPDTTAKGGHRYWSNAEADLYMAAEDRRCGGADPAEGAAERIWGAP